MSTMQVGERVIIARHLFRVGVLSGTPGVLKALHPMSGMASVEFRDRVLMVRQTDLMDPDEFAEYQKAITPRPILPDDESDDKAPKGLKPPRRTRSKRK